MSQDAQGGPCVLEGEEVSPGFQLEEESGHHGRLKPANFFSRLTPRMRAAARLLSTGYKESEVCETLKFSPQYLNKMKQQEVFQRELERFMTVREEVALDAYLEIVKMNPRFVEIIRQEVDANPDESDSFARNRRWEVVKFGLRVQGVSPISKKDIRSQSTELKINAVLDELATRWGRHQEEFG